MTRFQAQFTTSAVANHDSAIHLTIPAIGQSATKFTTSRLQTLVQERLQSTITFLRRGMERVAMSLQHTRDKLCHWAEATRRYVQSDEMDWVGCISFLTLTAAAILLNFII